MTTHYPPPKFGFLAPGTYRGHLAVTANRRNSAAAWSCGPEGLCEREALSGSGKSESKSTANRASARAVLRILELCAPESKLVVICDLDLTVNALNEDLARWALNGWRASAGPLKNDDIWRSIYALIISKKLDVTAAKPLASSEDAKIIAALKLQAKDLLQ